MFLVFYFLFFSLAHAGVLSELSPKHAELVKSSRDVVSRVDFVSGESLKFYAAFQTAVSIEATSQVMTRYGDYEKFIPFVSRSRYDADLKELLLEGGVLGWVLSSRLKMTQFRDGKLEFEIIGGHFKGMKGQMVLERTPDYKTLVLFQGSLTDRKMHWPPAWVVENGGKIVFQLSGAKLRELVEEEVKPKSAESVKNNVPEPRRPKTN